MIVQNLPVLLNSLGTNSMELLVYLDHVLSQFWQAQGRSEFVRDVEGVGKNIEMVVVVAGGRHLPVKLAGAA